MGTPVWVVEDDEDAARLFEIALKAEGRRIQLFRNGQEIWNQLAGVVDGKRAPPGLILMDLDLPDIHGLELLRRVRSRSELDVVPVIVITSSPRADWKEQVLAMKTTEWVNKPVDYGAFLSTVADVLRRWNHRAPGVH